MTDITIYTAPIVAATPMPRIRNLIIAGGLIGGVFVLGGGVWATLAPLQSAVSASGVVEVESSRKTVQHLEGGIVGAILVHDGEKVVAGQALIRLDGTKARTTLGALQGQMWDAQAREARLIAERDGKDHAAYPDSLTRRAADPGVAAVIAGQDKVFQTRRELQSSKIEMIGKRILATNEEIVGLRAQEVAATQRISLINEEIKGIKELVDKGLERKPRLLGLQRDLADIQGRHGDTVAQIARAQQTIAESQVNIINTRNDAQNEVAGQLSDAQKQIHELGQQMQAATDVLDRIDIRAPQDGTVTDLQIHTPGGVINAGEKLLDLVPDEKVIVTVQIRPEDIDVVRTGLPALVRLLPYKTRRTPPIDATLIYVSADRLVEKANNQPYYAAKIRVDQAKLEALGDVEMLPGMPAEVSIRTGKTTPAIYALSPILDSFHRAFGEK
ncbi:MAG: HlyD family type secretion periplasmic adaptor subunit [Rhodospirillales bacterium]|nr:HlyD family type secretion periplasmic adaptor subunit [Rhodospirillales bacterium]